MARSHSKVRDDTTSSRSRLIIGLIVLSLFLVLGLAWQALQAMRIHLETATGVLQDYGRLAADEYVRRAMGEVGYYGYYAYGNLLRQQASRAARFPFELDEPPADSPAARARRLARYVFFYDGEADELSFAGGPAPDAEVVSALHVLADEFSRGPLPETGFEIIHSMIDRTGRTFVLTRGDDDARAIGFEVDRSALGRLLGETFDKGSLLPASLADGAVTNDYVYLRFADQSDHVLFETGGRYDPYLIVANPIGDDYNGIFQRHTVSAAIDPDIADMLVIGGLPRSRLPLLVVVLIVTVGLLGMAIRQLQRERAVVRMRTNFVSEVSHELRTPLTQIRIFAETLLFDRVRSPDDRHRALEVINRESQRLIHLVENVLQFANGGGSKRRMRTECQMLGPVVERVIDEFRSLAGQTGASIVYDLAHDAAAQVDADAVRQILVNLLDNAVKYGPTGQTIRIEVISGPGHIHLMVADEGPGIPRAERERIWSGYYRLERERRSAIAGTGIGLAVVRELAALQGGRSWVENGDGRGARFVVEFPSVGGGNAAPVKSSAAPIPRLPGEPG